MLVRVVRVVKALMAETGLAEIIETVCAGVAKMLI